MKTIEITISRTGQTTIHSKGFEGTNCREGTEFLTKSLGQQASEQLTPEFYSHHQTSQVAQERK